MLPQLPCLQISGVPCTLTKHSCSRAPPVVELEHNTVPDTQPLVDVDSPHINSVDTSFKSQSEQTSTQRDRLHREAHDAKINAQKGAKKAKAKADSFFETAQKNSDNPVFIGNGILAAALAGVIGFGAYKKFSNQTVTPEGWTVGAVAAAVGVIAVGDYFLSSWALENKYPAKK